MASEAGYRARVMPQAAAAMPLARPESYGAGLADALAAAGDEGHRLQLRDYAIQRRLTGDREAADFAHKRALHRQSMDEVIQKLRTNPSSPDYADHVARVMEAEQAGREAMLEGITEDSVRQQAAGQLDNDATALHSHEFTFAEGERIKKTGADYEGIKQIYSGRVFTGHATGAEALKAMGDFIDSQENLLPAQRRTLQKDATDTIGAAQLKRGIDTNPQATLAMIDAGAFDFLGEAVLEQARNAAMVEIRRAEAAAAHAANVAKSTLAEQIATVKAEVVNGAVYSAEQLAPLVTAANAANDTSSAEQLRGIGYESAFNEVWANRPPLQWEARIRELNGIAADKRTPVQLAELKMLNDKFATHTNKFNADPAGFVVQNGIPAEQPAPLDPANPATFTARASWRRAAAGANGRMNLLTKAERDQYLDDLRSGDAGYNRVVEDMAKFGGQDARQAARELAPDDFQLQQLVLLPRDYRKLASDGRQYLRDKPALLKLEPEEQADVDLITRELDAALQALPAGDITGIRTVAQQIAAKLLHDSPDSIFEPTLWKRALDMALGATGSGAGKHGGLGFWNDKGFLVPDDLTAQQFTDRVFGFIRRNPAKGPVNLDGSPFNLRMARPVAVKPGVYQFYVGRKPVLGRGKDGKITSAWQFTVGGAR